MCECVDGCKTISCPCIALSGVYFKTPTYDCTGKLSDIDCEFSRPIFECTPGYCKTCDGMCCNRVVTQNLTHTGIMICDSGMKGKGVITTRYIKKGEFLCSYTGENILTEVALQRLESSNNRHSYILTIRELFGDGKVSVATHIDATYCDSIAKYINHSCNPNLSIEIIRSSCDDFSDIQVGIFANSDIETNTEISFDYGGGDDVTNSFSQKPCLCGAKTCRKYMPFSII